MADALESRTLSRVAWRFIPFLIVCYFVAYLDRVNVGFAKLTMDADLGLSETAFGFGAGVFFLAYFLFEVPSNIIMDKVGARRWIARIMLTWGLGLGRDGLHPRDRFGDRVKRGAHLLSPARAARLRRGRLLPRHHLLPDALVPGLAPGAHRRLFHGGDPAVFGAGLAGLRGAARPRRRLGPPRLAVAVHRRGPALDHPRLRHVLLPDRPARRRGLARPGGPRLAATAARARGPAARARFAGERARKPRRHARAGAGAGLFRRRRLHSTASASGCRRSSRASACRSR